MQSQGNMENNMTVIKIRKNMESTLKQPRNKIKLQMITLRLKAKVKTKASLNMTKKNSLNLPCQSSLKSQTLTTLMVRDRVSTSPYQLHNKLQLQQKVR